MQLKRWDAVEWLELPRIEHPAHACYLLERQINANGFGVATVHGLADVLWSDTQWTQKGILDRESRSTLLRRVKSGEVYLIHGIGLEPAFPLLRRGTGAESDKWQVADDTLDHFVCDKVDWMLSRAAQTKLRGVPTIPPKQPKDDVAPVTKEAPGINWLGVDFLVRMSAGNGALPIQGTVVALDDNGEAKPKETLLTRSGNLIVGGDVTTGYNRLPAKQSLLALKHGNLLIPLGFDKVDTTKQQPTSAVEHTLLAPLILRRYTTPRRILDEGDLLEPGCCVYIFMDGHLWRELKVAEGRIFQDIDLGKYYGEDYRKPSANALTLVTVPVKLNGRTPKLEIALSPVQWSWARILAFGGLHDKDPRKDKKKDTVKVEQVDSKKRSARLATLDISKLEGSDWSVFSKREDVKAYKDKALSVCHLDDPVGWARGLAGDYQEAWFELESFIGEISNPDNKKKHPFAPWFDSAVLANQYFFVEHPDINAPGQQIQLSQNEKQALKQAKDQRAEWCKKLSLSDIQTALGTEQRKTIRNKIKKTKQALVDFLSKDCKEDSPLIAAIDDIATLPAMEKTEDDYVDYAELHRLADQLLARLGDHEYARDHYLETEPPTQKQLYKLAQNDPGVELLTRIADPDSHHPLHKRLFPNNTTQNGDASTQSASSQNVPTHDPIFSAVKLAIVGRRASQTVSAWIEHYASVAANNLNVQKSLVRFITAGKIAPHLAEITRKSVPLEDFLLGKAPQGYEFLRVAIKEADEEISRRAALELTGDKVVIEPNKAINLDLYTPDGKRIGATTLENFRKGRAFSSRAWSQIRHNTQWKQHTVEVWVAKRPTSASRIGRWGMEKGVWTGVILPLVVVLEGWNLNESVKQFVAVDGFSNREFVNLTSAIADGAAIVASINQARYTVAHHAAEKAAGQHLPLSEKHTHAIRWARGFGIAAGAFSAGLSIQDMMRNAQEGDDAAIAHGLMGAGFILVTASEIAGAAAAYGVGGSLVAFVSGPVVWIGLAVVMAGAALLTWVFTEDTPLEEWLANGPFSRNNNRLLGKFQPWLNNPATACQALIEAIYTPTVTLTLHQSNMLEPWEAVLKVDIPNYIDNKTRLLPIELWQSERNGAWKKVEEKLHLVTSQIGSGPRTVEVIVPLQDQYSGKVKATVRLDLYGDGKNLLPSSKTIELMAGPPQEHFKAL